MPLVYSKDLRFGRNGLVAKLSSIILYRLLGIDKINKIYEYGVGVPQTECASRILEGMNCSYSICDKDLSNIPIEGPVIVIANHPTGAMDGVMLIDALTKIRPDVKFMGNFLLNKIDYLSNYFIAVDPFNGASVSRNMAGIRSSLAHLKQGGMLVIFPAGEVATYQRGFSRVSDKKWSNSILKFIRTANVPVLPICIEGRNSRVFHLLGKIHPMLRTAMLPHEFINKRGKIIDINIGTVISVRRVAELTDLGVYGGYLRANVDFLRKKHIRHKTHIIPRRKHTQIEPDDVISPIELCSLKQELQSISAEHLLLKYGEYNVYFAPPQEIPNIMTEIGRLREITFRAVGEGTMKGIDTDDYDLYYHQLFVWDTKCEALVGAYRMGMGDYIVKNYGLKGFYTNSLFKMNENMIPIMERTIELGRSFIVKEYQRKSVSLLLLWKGIVYVLMKHEKYRNLLGPVTISGEFETVSKTLIVKYLQKHHMDHKLASNITPITGLDGINSHIDYSLIEDISSIELINKIVCDIERDELSIPILLKKYLHLNSHVLGFNVDHGFCDALDALILLDLKKVPKETIHMLSKEITEIDVLARFSHIN